MTPLHAKLMNPPNAVPDTGINMRNGRPVMRVVQPPPCLWSTPKLTLIWKWDPPPPEPEVKTKPDNRPPGFRDPQTTSTLVINETCITYDLERYQILANIMIPKAFSARNAAMAIIRRLTPLSLCDIGRLFDGRDHSSVAHANRKMAPHIAALNQEFSEWSAPAVWVRALKARLEA